MPGYIRMPFLLNFWVFICAIFPKGFVHVSQPSLLCQPEKSFEYSAWEACLLHVNDLGRVRKRTASLPLDGQCFLLFISCAHVKIWNVCSSTWAVSVSYMISLSLSDMCFHLSPSPLRPFSPIQPLIYTPSHTFAREWSGATPPPSPLAQCWWRDSHGRDPSVCYDPLRST